MNNRRRSERYRVELPVRLRDAHGGDEAHTADVSAHGIAIATSKRRPLRQYVELEITLPPPAPKISATALVARLIDDLDVPGDHGKLGLGLDFFLFDARAKNEWQRFIAKMKADRFERPSFTGAADLSRPPLSVVPASSPPHAEHEAEAEAEAPTFIVKPRDLTRLWSFFRNEMSRGLVRIEAPVAMSPGDPVELLVVHPSTSAEWSLDGRVARTIARSGAARPVLEIALVALDEDARAQFRTFVQTGYGMIQEDVVLTGDLGAGGSDQVPILTPIDAVDSPYAASAGVSVSAIDEGEAVQPALSPAVEPAGVSTGRPVEAAETASLDIDVEPVGASIEVEGGGAGVTVDLGGRHDSSELGFEPVISWLETTEEEAKAAAKQVPLAAERAAAPANGDATHALAEARTEARVDAFAQGRTDVRADPLANARTDVRADAMADARTDVRPDAMADGRTDVKADPLAYARTDVRVDALADARTDARPDALAGASTEARADALAEASTEARADAFAEASTEAHVETLHAPTPPQSRRPKITDAEAPQTLSGKLFSSFFFEAAQARPPKSAIVAQPSAVPAPLATPPKSGPSIELKAIISPPLPPKTPLETHAERSPLPLPATPHPPQLRRGPPPLPASDLPAQEEANRAAMPEATDAAPDWLEGVRIVRGSPDQVAPEPAPAHGTPSPANGHAVPRDRHPPPRRASVTRPTGDEAMSATHRAVSTEGRDPGLDRDIAIARARVVRSPNSVTACYRLGTLLLRRGGEIDSWGEAITTLQRVMELEPNHPGAHHAVAEALMKRGELGKAAEHLQRARRLGYQVDPALERAIAEGKKG